ncbi:MAG TPA: hypothetical protein VGZ22_08835 [Isosphaeraceae bacterium]|jgi:hypothetical protein|nr:hypothetical protein [Isosphaeraceae bacterium]
MSRSLNPRQIQANLAKDSNRKGPTDRYSSFDYCFNYFQAIRESGRLATLLDGASLQISCLQLGFYLASWGMMRGLTPLQQKSSRALAPVVRTIVTADEKLWMTDADDYLDSTSRAAVLEFADSLRVTLQRSLRNADSEERAPTDTLISKIMLGTMGCVPAFDAFFCQGFRTHRLSDRSLQDLGTFYAENRKLIDGSRVCTFDFDTQKRTRRRHTRAKVIDTIFWVEGSKTGRANR